MVNQLDKIQKRGTIIDSLSSLLIISLNVNELITPIKRQRLFY